MNRFRTLAIALVALVALPATASAATVTKTGSTITYIADAQEINDVSISLAGDVYTINEQGNSPGQGGITVKNGGGCQVGSNSTTATCPAAGTTLLNVETGDGGDTVRILAPTAARILGGEGNDNLNGGDGNDQILGTEGSDSLNGGGGDDGLDGQADGDSIAGGAGTDAVDYASRVNAVTVTLDDQGGDGEQSENDNVASDVENVNGGAGGDTITGSGATNVLTGNGGNDTLSGLAGSDTLYGNAGDDVLIGGADTDVIAGGDGFDFTSYVGHASAVRVSLDGDANDGVTGENDNVGADIEGVTGTNFADILIGNSANNILQGTLGDDRLLGGTGADTLDGGDGNDSIQALDKVVDQVQCGNGTDGAIADTSDVLNGCETVQRSVVSILTAKAKMRRGILRITLLCSPYAADGCGGSLALKYKRTNFGRKAYKLPNGGKRTIKVKVPRTARRLLLRKRKLTATATASTKDTSGFTSRSTKKVKLTR